jgi:hypothetical protein
MGASQRCTYLIETKLIRINYASALTAPLRYGMQEKSSSSAAYATTHIEIWNELPLQRKRDLDIAKCPDCGSEDTVELVYGYPSLNAYVRRMR